MSKRCNLIPATRQLNNSKESLKDFQEDVKLVEVMIHDQDLRRDVPYPRQVLVDLLGFDPKKILRTEEARTKSAEEVISKIRARQRPQDQLTLDRLTAGLSEQISRLETYSDLIYKFIDHIESHVEHSGVWLVALSAAYDIVEAEKSDPDDDWNPEDDLDDPNVMALMENEGYYPTDLIPIDSDGYLPEHFDQ